MNKDLLLKQMQVLKALKSGLEIILNVVAQNDGKQLNKRIVTKIKEELESKDIQGVIPSNLNILSNGKYGFIDLICLDRCHIMVTTGSCEYVEDYKKTISFDLVDNKKIKAKETIKDIKETILRIDSDIMLLTDNISKYEEYKAKKEEIKKLIEDYNKGISRLLYKDLKIQVK